MRANLNSVLQIEGLLRTMFDPRMTLMQQVSAELESHFGDKVYQSIIPRNVRLAEAPSYGKPVIAFDRQSKGAQAYLQLAQEMLDRRDGRIALSAPAAETAPAGQEHWHDHEDEASAASPTRCWPATNRKEGNPAFTAGHGAAAGHQPRTQMDKRLAR